MKVIIDNGHGADTPGKCSPDGTFREATYTRRLAAAIVRQLAGYGIESHILVPESGDVPLRERVRRANALCRREPCVLLSLHVNAAGNSGWHSARGFSAWVAPGASETSRRLAAALSSGAAAIGYRGNRSSPPRGYWTGNFAILRDTLCPAVLSENMFMDNVADLAFLKSPRSVEILAALHAKVLAEIIPDI